MHSEHRHLVILAAAGPLGWFFTSYSAKEWIRITSRRRFRLAIPISFGYLCRRKSCSRESCRCWGRAPGQSPVTPFTATNPLALATLSDRHKAMPLNRSGRCEPSRTGGSKSTAANAPMTASGGCGRSRFYRGDHRRGHLLSQFRRVADGPSFVALVAAGPDESKDLPAAGPANNLTGKGITSWGRPALRPRRTCRFRKCCCCL
jgi:hypothetical protein